MTAVLIVHVPCLHRAVLCCAVLCYTYTRGRAQLVLTRLKGNLTQCSRLLAQLTVGSTLLELLTNPSWGTLTDRHGRRPLLLLSMAVNAGLKAGVCYTGALWSAVLDAVVSGAMSAVSSSAINAAIADISSPDAMPGRQAVVGIAGGMGFVIGPIFGGIISGRYGARTAYACGAAVAAMQTLYLSVAFPETVDLSKPRPPRDSPLVNPLSAIKLFQGGRELAVLAMVGTLQCALEAKAWSNTMMVFLRGHVGLTPAEFGRFSASFAVASIIAKFWVKHSISLFGTGGHTTISNVATAVAFFIWGSSKRLWASVAALLIAPLHLERRRTVLTTANNLAAKEGMGNGEFNAYMSNLRAVVIMGTALALDRVRNVSSRPGFALQILGTVALLAEAIHQQSHHHTTAGTHA